MRSFWSRTFARHRKGRDTQYIRVTGFRSLTCWLLGARLDRHRFESDLSVYIGPVMVEVWWSTDG